jgi:hypothetical protein
MRSLGNRAVTLAPREAEVFSHRATLRQAQPRYDGAQVPRYEDNVIDLLLENLDRLWRGERELENQRVANRSEPIWPEPTVPRNPMAL